MIEIKCPACSARFHVSEDYLGQLVECGSCEHQFTVDQPEAEIAQSVSRHPVYRHSDLSSFSRTFSSATASSGPVKKQPELPYMPLPVWKYALQFIGLGVFLLGVLFLSLGSVRNGFLTDVALPKRLIFAGSIFLICSICFLRGMRTFKSIFLSSLVAACALGSLAYFSPIYTTPTSTTLLEGARPSSPQSSKSSPSFAEPTRSSQISFQNDLSIDRLKVICQYGPVEKAIRLAQDQGDEKASSVAAIWIYGEVLQYHYLVADYFQRALGLKIRPDYYQRDQGLLLIINNLNHQSIQDVAKSALIFGTLNDIHSAERLVSVSFEETYFRPLNAVKIEALNESENPDFYGFNIQELIHFDASRVTSAIRRLTQVEQLRFRPDVIDALMLVLSRYRDPELTDLASQCLQRWIGDYSTEEKERIIKAANLPSRGTDPQFWPRSLVGLLLTLQVKEMESMVIDFWKAEPIKWESTLLSAPQLFTEELLPHLSKTDKTKNLSIINILSKAPPQEALPALRKARAQLGPEYATLFQTVIERLDKIN